MNYLRIIPLCLLFVLSMIPTGFACHHEAKASSGCAKKSCPIKKDSSKSCSHGADKKRACKHHSKSYAHHGAKEHGNFFLDYADEIKLTDTQVASLNKLRNSARIQREKNYTQIKTLKQNVMKLSHQEGVKKKSIQKITQKIGKLKGQMLENQIFNTMKARDILTVEQRKMVWEKFGPKKEVSETQKS